MNDADLQILLNTLPGKEKPPAFAIKLLEDTCARTGLDWKMRHLYLMQRGGKWGVTLSIDGFRLIGSQDPEYAGQEGPFWVTSADGVWTDVPPDGPIYAAKVGIKHRNGTVTWGVAKYKDYAAGAMWSKFPSTMVAKCAEMLAWRKAMPGRLGGLYGIEEMEQSSSREEKGSRSRSKSSPTEPEKPEPEPEMTEGDLDAVKNKYLLKLDAAKDPVELKAVGAAIQASGLSLEIILELHKFYTEKMNGFYKK